MPPVTSFCPAPQVADRHEGNQGTHRLCHLFKPGFVWSCGTPSKHLRPLKGRYPGPLRERGACAPRHYRRRRTRRSRCHDEPRNPQVEHWTFVRVAGSPDTTSEVTHKYQPQPRVFCLPSRKGTCNNYPQAERRSGLRQRSLRSQQHSELVDGPENRQNFEHRNDGSGRTLHTTKRTRYVPTKPQSCLKPRKSVGTLYVPSRTVAERPKQWHVGRPRHQRLGPWAEDRSTPDPGLRPHYGCRGAEWHPVEV